MTKKNEALQLLELIYLLTIDWKKKMAAQTRQNSGSLQLRPNLAKSGQATTELSLEWDYFQILVFKQHTILIAWLVVNPYIIISETHTELQLDNMLPSF